MSDLIDRQELIYSLECLPFYHEFWKPEGCEDLWESEAVVNRIKNMPPAQRWIPITKRLPEDNQRVIVQMINGHIDILNFNSNGLTGHLLAWMPLPEPYKGGDNE